MIRIEKSITIARPVEVVFAFITNMDSVKLWLPVKEVRAISGGPMHVGATFAQTAEFMGQKFDSTIEVTEYNPPGTFAFKMIKGPFPLTNRMTCTPHEEGTELTLIGEAEPGNALKFAGPFITTLVKKQLESQVSTLKRILETEEQ